MGKSIPILLLNGKSWAKKGDATAHFKAMLNRYAVGEIVSDASDFSDLLALIKIYDPGKMGSGVAYFEKRPDLDHAGNTACFFIVRSDGSAIDFSIYRALDAVSKASSHKT